MSTDGAVREVPGLGPVAGDEGAVETPRPALKLPDKPSIAILAFTNLSGDPQQEYLADGIVDDIITELSRFSELFVIARNSSFQYKGRAVDVRQVGRELGVHYVLEGSMRRGGDRVRRDAGIICSRSMSKHCRSCATVYCEHPICAQAMSAWL